MLNVDSNASIIGVWRRGITTRFIGGTVKEKPATEQIDDIITKHDGWKAAILQQIREAVNAASPEITEEVKWKTASRPEGLPVWSLGGILCIAEVWKDNVKLIFFKGAQMRDTNKLFNARLKSSTDRAVEFREGDPVDKAKLTELTAEAIEINQLKKQ